MTSGWRRAARAGYRALLPRRHYRARRELRERTWSNAAYVPNFEAREIPPETREAVETGWFPPGVQLLDIGCGSGWIGAWLADRGYRVVGVDYSRAAIARARSAHPEQPGKLRWRVADIVHDEPPTERFGAMLDRGCLSHVPPRYWPTYTHNVRACAAPGAAFLLLLGPLPDAPRERAQAGRLAARALDRHFSQERVAETRLNLADGTSRPALAFWMRAREGSA